MLSNPSFSNPILLKRTNDTFTTGLVNLPIILKDGKPIKHYDDKKHREKYDVVPDMRYPFFEYDFINEVKDRIAYSAIMKAYRVLNLPVYFHRTLRGFHFICLVALHKDCYAKWIKPLMKYNPKCPMTTLRIKPNKWVNEKEVFKQGGIVSNIMFNSNASNIAISEIEKVKTWIERQHIGLLQMNYYIVHYRMTGELGNL